MYKIISLYCRLSRSSSVYQIADWNLLFPVKDILTHLPNITAFLAQAQLLIDNNADEDYEIVRMDIDRFRVISGMFGIEEVSDKIMDFASSCRLIFLS